MGFKIQGEFSLKGNAASSLKEIGGALRGVKNDGAQVGGVLGRTSNAMKNAGSSANRAGQEARSGARGFTAFGQTAQRAGDMAQRAARRAGDAWHTSANTIKGAGNGLRAGLTGVFNLPNALLAGGVGLVGKGIIDAVGYKEQRLVGLKTLFGSATLAAKAYAFAESEASKSPFETTSVLESVQGLKAWSFTAQQIPNTFRAIANAASGLSLGDVGLSDLTTIFGQIKSSLTLTLGDTKQLQSRGFDAFGALAKSYNVTKGDIGKMISKRQIAGEDAVNILLEYAAKKYKGASDDQGKTIFGLASTLKSRPFELFSSLDVNKELKPFKSVLENLTTLTDFKNNPTGKKIAARFQQSMGLVFKGGFGGLAKYSKPEEVGKMLDKVFEKLDMATSWLAKNGPSIVNGFKSFFGGIGDTINGVRSTIEWSIGAFKQLTPALEKMGLLKSSPVLGGESRSGHSNGRSDPGGGSSGMFSGTNLARIGGAALTGLVGAKFLNGLLGGIPGKIIGGTLGMFGKAFGGLINMFGGKNAKGVLGALELGGVQKVFVVNMPGGFGKGGSGAGSGFEMPDFGKPGKPGRSGPARMPTASTRPGGFLSRVGNLLSTDLTPIVRNGLNRFRAGLSRTWQALNPANIGAAFGRASRGIGANIMRSGASFAGRFSQSMTRFFPTVGTMFRRGASLAQDVRSRLPAMRSAMVNMVTRVRQDGSLLATRIGQGLTSTARRVGSSLLGSATRFGSSMIGVSRTVGTSLLTFGARFGASVIGFATTLGTSLVGLGARVGASMIGFSTTFSGGLAALSGTILGKLGMAAAAFGAGWAIGTALNGVNTGGVNNETGGSRTLGYDVQESLRYTFFNGAKADQEAQDAENRMFAAQMNRKRQQNSRLRKAGQTNGAAYGTGLTNGVRSGLPGANQAGKSLGDATSNGTRKTLDVRSPSRVAHHFGRMYGAGLEGGLRGHLKPVQRAAQTLAAAAAVSPVMAGLGGFNTGSDSSANMQAGLQVANARPAVQVGVRPGPGGARGGGVQVTVNFNGGINLGGAASPKAGQEIAQAVKRETTAAVEQAVLEAFERLAMQMGGQA
jgi:hypothetical protein